MPIADWSITNPFFFEPKFSVDVVPTPTVIENHQNIAHYINQSSIYN